MDSVATTSLASFIVYFPACHVKVPRLYQSCFHLLLPSPPAASDYALNCPEFSGHCQISTASSRSQWALPDLSGERQILIGLQLREPDLSGHWGDLNCECKMSHRLSARMSDTMSDRMPDRMSGGCQNKYPEECQNFRNNKFGNHLCRYKNWKTLGNIFLLSSDVVAVVETRANHTAGNLKI
jgi:hypothetical protein